MQDSKKTKAQLIEELERLRAYIEAIERKEEGESGPPSPPRSKRKGLSTDIQFIGDFGLIEARGVNLSEGGICFDAVEEIPFDMEFSYAGKDHQHRARMVWMKRLPDGRSRFGFEFVPAKTSDLLWLYRELKNVEG